MEIVAVIEDDVPTSNQLRGWIEAARPGIVVHQWFNRDDAEAALSREHYDVVVLDIELGRERHAGVAIINTINKQRGTPVLVVSAMPATIYRSIMKALDAWDYLQKTTFEEADFIDTFLEILRAAKDQATLRNAPAAAPPVNELSLDPLRQSSPIWRGQRVNLPLTAQRILATLHQRRGEVVSYEDLFQVVKSGRNRDNIRKHVSTIRDAFRDIDPAFDGIENVPMRGFPLGAAEGVNTQAANWLRLPGRVPFRLRVFFRGAFLLLALATLALALNVLQDEKQRSHRNYAEGLRKNQAQIAARLRHPTGQLSLLNPSLAERAPTPLRPLVLPFSALDFDDRNKAQQAAEMAGCLLQYPQGATLCAAVGNNPYSGGFIYLVGSVAAGTLVAHTPGDLDLASAHRVRVEVVIRGQTYRWIAPFEASADAGAGAGVRGRLTGFVDDVPVTPATRPVRDFRGWLWQEGRCVAAGAAAGAADCSRRTFFSVRLPVEVLRDTLTDKRLVWPPPDLDQVVVRLSVLPPGDAPPLFDSDAAGAVLPFSLADLKPLLLPGETLRVRKLQPAGTGEAAPRELFRLVGANDAETRSSPWLDRLIRALPVEGYDAPIELREAIGTPLGAYEIVLTGDVRSVNRGLAAVATRVSWFVGAMLLAVLATWLAIELRIIRRITLLTKRAASVSTGVRGSSGLASIDLSDLRGSDELGVLALGLQDLLQRVNEDVRREQIRAEQEKDMWHAVGHEIMSPLQSLMALHGAPGDASHRYISRMQQAVRVLYGHASPSEAFQSTTLQLQMLDLNQFLVHVAANAPYMGIEHVTFEPAAHPVPVRADEHSLEDVVAHVLRNAERYRPAGAPIGITLDTPDPNEARVHIHNPGPPIPPELIDKVFEYGVSDQPEAGASGHRGQGLFVARTYMAKMGGTIVVHNVHGGVEFTLTLPRA